MDLSHQANLLEQQLAAMQAQEATARQAHLAITQGAGVPGSEELCTITASMTQLVQLAREAAPNTKQGVTATVHSYHAEIDQVLQRANRLLREHRELVERTLGQAQRQPASCDTKSAMTYERDSYSLYAHLSVLEAYLQSIRGIANQALSFVISKKLDGATKAG